MVMVQPTEQTLSIYKWPSWYLNFSARFMQNVLFEYKKVELWNKWNIVKNETLYSAPEKCSKFLFPNI
jgi:hypothetical protein